jgi:alkanesulfonate monooxygenase
MFGAGIHVYTTCSQSKDVAEHYLANVIQVSQWSEAAGCSGMLIYSDNSIIDPWLVAQVVIQATRSLAPLVAVQPVYMHPYTVAKMVTSFALLHGRAVALNMIAGGFRGDLIALGDPTEHDQRYDRIIEYCQIIQNLLSGQKVTVAGRYYQTQGLQLTPSMPVGCEPVFLMSGSSPAGRAAGRAIGATSVEYPEPANLITQSPVMGDCGIRVGIIAHECADEAWRIALDRFPANRRGHFQHVMAMRTSDSSWQQKLGSLAHDSDQEPNGVYWLWPFKQYHTFCPYLVGDYPTVAREIARYLRFGYNTFILDIPRAETDLMAAIEVFRQARDMV